jgi:2-keto-4-pentenoate hydratase/2-oxohepta-3-ene-1,7-dioic acid hydratase in catechol pathway
MTTPMKAVVFALSSGSRRLGRLEGDTVIDAGEIGDSGFVPTPENWAHLRAADGIRRLVSDVRLCAPVRPSKILAIGLNYRAHAAESELDVPTVPVVFSKLPSSVIASGESIVIPFEETRPDFEGELAIVLGQRVYRADAETARAAVGAITAVHDVSGRRAQLETPLRQFTLGKSFDTFTPLGPCLTEADGIDLTNITVSTVVSGETMQDASTADLIFPVVDLIQYLSRGLTLEAGDVIATGTPGGVGDSRVPPRYLRDGDVVEITVSHVGTLINPVTFER